MKTRLCLSLVNENTNKFSYRERCALGSSDKTEAKKSVLWAKMLAEYATQTTLEWGDQFTDEDILAAAAEVARYYAEHVKELDNT